MNTVPETIYEHYEIVIGLEIHVQLNTVTKAFCADSNRFGDTPNTNISPISLGHPGTLPRPNMQHIESAIKMGLALGTHIHRYNYFARKNYFYPDLPKGYQISQDTHPICGEGHIEILGRNIRILRIHMEEDAGKLVHEEAGYYSLADLNRAGTPLLEIVSYPDLRSAEEAAAYASEIRRLVRYLNISDGNMEEGSFRCDCNVSVRKKGETHLNNRCEIKNINSFRFIKRAIEYEAKRQIDSMENGEKIIQQTRSYIPEKDITVAMRDKEDAHDYRYFPEPDIPPIFLTDAQINAIRASMPALPNELRKKMEQEFALSDYDVQLLTEEKEYADYFLAVAAETTHYKAIANWLLNPIKSYLNEKNKSLLDFPISPKQLADIISLCENGEISTTVAVQKLLPALLQTPLENPKKLAEKLHLLQINDNSQLESWVEGILANFPEKVKEYQKGKKGLIGFFMGEVMKLSGGTAEAKKTQELLAEKLKK